MPQSFPSLDAPRADRTRLSRPKRFSFTLVVLMLFAAVLEIGLRVHDSFHVRGEIVEAYDTGLGIRHWEVHHALRPHVEMYDPDPDTGMPVLVRTNSFGLRGDEPAVPKPEGVFRILCLGDSFTFGVMVDEEATFCAQLARELSRRSGRRVEVINCGVPSYAPLLEYLQYRHQLGCLEPDLVVLNFDMSDVQDDYRYRPLARFDAEGRPLSCHEPRIELPPEYREGAPALLVVDRVARGIDALTAGEGRVHAAESGMTVAEDPADDGDDSIASTRNRYRWLEDRALSDEWSAAAADALEPIAQLAELTRAQRVPLVLAAYPYPWQVSGDASCGETAPGDAPARGLRQYYGIERGEIVTSARPFELLSAFAATHDVPFVNAAPAFRSHTDSASLYFRNDLHFNAAGHALYARVLADYLSPFVPR